MNDSAKKSRTIGLLALGALLLVSYQNCSGVKFTSSPLESKAVDDTVHADDLPPEEPGGSIEPLPTQPDQPDLPSQAEESDEPADYDHMGRKIRFGCASGATAPLDFSQDLSSAQDLTLNHQALAFGSNIEKARNVSIDGLSTAVFNLKMADHVLLARDVNAAAVRMTAKTMDLVQEVNTAFSRFRSLDVKRFETVHGAVTALAARTVTDVENIHAAVFCLSGQEIGRVDNLHGAYLKLVGRTDGQSPAHLGTLSRVNGFASLANLNVDRIEMVRGLLVIRGGEVGEISDFQGQLALIGTKVGRLSRMSGQVFVKNAEIAQMESSAPQVIPIK